MRLPPLPRAPAALGRADASVGEVCRRAGDLLLVFIGPYVSGVGGNLEDCGGGVWRRSRVPGSGGTAGAAREEAPIARRGGALESEESSDGLPNVTELAGHENPETAPEDEESDIFSVGYRLWLRLITCETV